MTLQMSERRDDAEWALLLIIMTYFYSPTLTAYNVAQTQNDDFP